MKMNFQIILASCLLLAVNGFFINQRGRDGTCSDPVFKNGQHDKMESTWFHWTHPIFTTLNFVCDEGYQLIGPKSATCQMNGEWTRLPECTEITGVAKTKSICDLPAIGDSVEVYPKKPTYDLQETVIFLCKNPRKSNTIAVTACEADGQFQPSPPKCIEPRCNPPEVPRNGGLRSSQPSYAVGEKANFKCSKGYTLFGNNTVTCGKDGYFPYAETRCQIRGSCAGRCGEQVQTSFCSCDPTCMFDTNVKCCHDFWQCTNWISWFNGN